jgi:hypothetical protein
MFARFSSVAAVLLLCGCTDTNRHPQPPITIDKATQAKVQAVDRPFMEHPSGDFETAVDAMADAIKRLRAMPARNDWITFQAAGMGGRVDSYHFAKIRMRQDEFELQEPIVIDIELVTQRAGVPPSCLSKKGGAYSIANATPMQAARIMDVIFRHYLGIRPHTGEGDDYGVCAEW